MLPPPLPGRWHPVTAPILAAPASGQGAHDHALLVEDVEVPPLHRLNVVITGDRLPAPGGLFSPQSLGFAHTNHKRIPFHFVVSTDHSPTRTQSQQLF